MPPVSEFGPGWRLVSHCGRATQSQAKRPSHTQLPLIRGNQLACGARNSYSSEVDVISHLEDLDFLHQNLRLRMINDRMIKCAATLPLPSAC
eukprot:1188028-Prorocentrum_minimum.AAC.2